MTRNREPRSPEPGARVLQLMAVRIGSLPDHQEMAFCTVQQGMVHQEIDGPSAACSTVEGQEEAPDGMECL